MEVTLGATVTSSPSFFNGAHGEHERFRIRTDANSALGSRQIDVVDNVGIAPRIAVTPGDHIEVRGEFIAQTAHGPIVHWTHHDPGGHHENGWIRWNGRLYA